MCLDTGRMEEEGPAKKRIIYTYACGYREEDEDEEED